MKNNYIGPDTVVFTITFEQAMLQSSFTSNNPVPDATEGDVSGWGDWAF